MELRAIEDHEVEAWVEACARTFGGDAESDPEAAARHRALVALDRTFAAFDGGRIVATAAGFDFQLSVPGGNVPMSGLTMVSVSPTHRRRGILRGLIAAHLAAARDHGDPVSGLWTSEATIYGRFGYGVAAEVDALTIRASGCRIATPGGRDDICLEPGEVALPAMQSIHTAVMADRPGLFSRTEAWWRQRILVARPFQRAGTSLRRFAIARRGDHPVGYAVFRQRLAFDAGAPTGRAEIDELLAVDASAEASLWDFLTHLDLFPDVAWRHAPTDCLLPWLLDDRHRVQRTRADALWLRIDDIPRALSARRYGADGALGLRIDGETFRLEVQGGVGVCRPSDLTPDLTMSRAALGALYLGAFPASRLARAGLVDGDGPSLARADRAFAAPTASFCPEIF
jgi:predicted acetyltransferase